VLAGAILAWCWYYGVWSVRDWHALREMPQACHPVWRDLYAGRIRSGDEIEPVITRTSPPQVDRFGRWVQLGYYPGPGSMTRVIVVARDGKLVSASAWSCTWHYVFFDTLTDQERRHLGQALTANIRKAIDQARQDE
jgi:hypothetical protein